MDAADKCLWENDSQITKLSKHDHYPLIILCWLPSHIGIPGDEAAHKPSKHALDLPIIEIAIEYYGV